MHSFGLLAGAFRPDDQVGVLRSYMCQRAMLVSYAGQHVQHVVADITGATDLRTIRAILAGERDQRSKHPESVIAKALEGD